MGRGRLHVVCGLPRSGSTLLCNLLMQNPDVEVTGTSPLSGLLETLRQALASSAEVVGMLERDRAGTERRIAEAARGLVRGWYPGSKVVIDKSRGIHDWSIHHQLLREVEPGAAILCTVRDPRAVMGSIERRNGEHPLLDQASGPLTKTLESRVQEMVGPSGVVGSAIVGVEDLLRRRPERVVIIRHEEFVQDPNLVLDQVYAAMRLPRHRHDVENVENRFPHTDALHRYKFPHSDAGGKIEPRPEYWQRHVSPDAAQWILNRWPFFCKKLGYA